MSDRPLVRYEPNRLLAWLYHRFFEHIEVDAAWAARVREAEGRGTVVYVLRNLSFVDFFALDYLTKRLKLPQIRFGNDVGLWVLEPIGQSWLNLFSRHGRESQAQDLRRAVSQGASAVLFLKRPPTAAAKKVRKKKVDGDLPIRTLLEAQRVSERPILLVPQTFIWSKEPDHADYTILDDLLGTREWPGNIRTIAQFLANYRHVTLRAGEPVDIKLFLAQEGHDAAGRPLDDELVVRRLTYTLLSRLEREQRAVLGPTKKSQDRLRAEVLRSPKLQKIIYDMAGEGAPERHVMTWRALAMLRELEALLDINALSAMNVAFERVTGRMYSGIEVDVEGLERLRAAAKDGTLILLPSHKSHVDYLIVSHLCYRHHLQPPLIAAGDNLAFFPLGPVFRRAGAFFIRRSFRGDKLYTAVVDAYIRRLIKDGWSLEFFLEGGRSRTGKLLSPKVGLLTMVVDAALSTPSRKVYFCPISIGYERVVEEKSFVREVSGAEKEKEDVKGLLATANIMVGRYGRLNVQFGEPLTLDGVLREFDPSASSASLSTMGPARRRAVITRLAFRVMNEINRVTAVTPGALVATALLTHSKRGMSHADLVVACERLARTLQNFGARFSPSLAHPTLPAEIRRAAIGEACELFIRAGHVEAHGPGLPVEGSSKKLGAASEDAIYVVPDEARLSLDLSKNIVVHFFISRALCATALLAPPGPPVHLDTMRDRVRALSRLFKYEFQFRADATFDQIFDEEIRAMVAAQELAREGDQIHIADNGARAQVVLYTQVIRNFIEGYRVAARGLTALSRGPLTPKDLAKRAIAMGTRMFLAGDIERREAVCSPVIEHAYLAFVDQGYVVRRDGKLALPESLASAEAVRTVEAKIAGYLTRRAADAT